MTSAPDRPGIPRPASRLVVLDARDRILLFHIDAPFIPRPIWLTPGGGVEPGESHEDAAIRELWEETGLRDVPLGPCVWRRQHTFEWNGRMIEARERFYVVRVEAHEVTEQNVDPYERDFLGETRWWSVEEMAAAMDERFVPRAMRSLLPAIIRGDYPPEPIDCGR